MEVNSPSFQLLQQATQDGPTTDAPLIANTIAPIATDGAVAPTSGQASEQASNVAPAPSQSPRPSQPPPPTNPIDLSNLSTAPIGDPDIEEALRQLRAGATVPEQDETPQFGPDGERIHTPKKRATYTREHKLAAIHFATNTYRIDKNGMSRLISGNEAAEILHVNWTVLAQWIRDVNRIEAMEPGTQKHRSKGKKHSLPPPKSDRNDKMRKVIFYHDPRTNTAGNTMSSILSGYPNKGTFSQQTHGPPPPQNGQIAYMHPSSAPQAQYPQYNGLLPPRQAGGPGGHGGLVSYDLPSFMHTQRRPDQKVCATLDDASESKYSDLQFSSLSRSKVDDSTVISSRLEATFVHRGSHVYQSTVKSSTIGDDAEVSSCSVENSLVVNCRVANCTILSSQVTGGQHVGKTFINTRITGNESPPKPAQPRRPSPRSPIATSDGDGEVDDEAEE